VKRRPATGPKWSSSGIAYGFAALVILATIIINVYISRNELGRIESDGWDVLSTGTDRKIFELNGPLRDLVRSGEFVAREALERRGRRSQLHLTQATTAFRWKDFEIRDAKGALIAKARRDTIRAAVDVPPDMIQEALRSGEPVMSVRPGREGPVIVVILPIVDPPWRSVVGIVFADPDPLFRPRLLNWPAFGAESGSYLVTRDGEETVILTRPPSSTVRAGTRIVAATGPMQIAVPAASGVETRMKARSRTGEVIWSLSRQVPDLGCSIVSQATGRSLTAGSRNPFWGLLLLDLAIALFAVAGHYLWKHEFSARLARHDLEVAQRHAGHIQSVFDSAFDAILTYDYSGRVQSANRGAERLFRMSVEELRQRSFAELIRLPGPARGRLPQPGRVSSAEARALDGPGVPVEVSISVVGEGTATRYTAIVRDVSERVAAEHRIRAFAEGLEASNRRLAELNAELEAASRLKSEFLANTSHELRTPLNGMIGFLQLVLDGMCRNPEEEHEFLRQALQCSRHLLGLINDVLDIAKIEAGKMTLEIQEVDPRLLFEEVQTVTHVQAAQKGLSLVFEPPTAPGRNVRGDFRKVKQVLINLVGNSVKFTAEGRVIVRVIERRDLGYSMFEVVDTGIGIPRDRQAVIFEKFMQGDGSTTRRFGGTGLGLAICKSLIELMGGVIGVESEGEGHGTRMYFSLPLWTGEEMASPVEGRPEEQIRGPAGGSLALIVEDDPSFRSYVQALLQDHGYRTVEARHAEAGWMLARRLNPAIVLLDYALSSVEGASVRTGWDLAERMASDLRTRHIPVLFITGFEDEVKERMRSNSFTRPPSHLVKPIEGPRLIATMESLLGQRSLRPVRILMAEDDPTVVAYVRKALPEERFVLEVANNGEECLHILRVQPSGFDLLLLDLMMPVVSGYDVLRELSSPDGDPSLPVLVLTNYPEGRTDEERALLEDGPVLDVLSKSAMHENPLILPHIIDWHLQVVARGEVEPEAGSAGTGKNEAEEAA